MAFSFSQSSAISSLLIILANMRVRYARENDVPSKRARFPTNNFILLHLGPSVRPGTCASACVGSIRTQTRSSTSQHSLPALLYRSEDTCRHAALCPSERAVCARAGPSASRTRGRSRVRRI